MTPTIHIIKLLLGLIPKAKFLLIIGSVEINQENYMALENAIRIIFTIAAMLCIPGLYFSMARGNFIKT